MASTKTQRKKLLSIVAAVSFGFSHFVSAESWQEGWYISWGHTNVRTKLISPDYPYSRKGDYTSNDPIFNFGYNFTENFGLEADACSQMNTVCMGGFLFPLPIAQRCIYALVDAMKPFMAEGQTLLLW